MSKEVVDHLITTLMNCGHVNKHKVDAGETWKYHFDKSCTVLLIFDEGDEE